MHNISSSGNYIVNTTEVVRNTVYSSGTFPRIEYRFNFWRKPTYYFLTLIIPGSLLVIISWFAMWTPVPPARTAISVTTLLTNFALRSSAMNMLPASSTISWLEQILTINVVLLFFGTVQTGMAFAAPSMLQITKEMRASWHKAKAERAERAERTRTDSDLVVDGVQAGEWDEVDGQLAEVSVELAGETQAHGHAGDDGRHEVVKITVGGGGQLETLPLPLCLPQLQGKQRGGGDQLPGTEADIVQGLVDDGHDLVGVLDKRRVAL
jgi:hypothetical protein